MVAEFAITSASDNRPEVRWLNRNWQPYREMMIRSKLWQFAKEEHELNADGTYTATNRWSYRYTFPNNALRLIPPNRYGKQGDLPVRYEVRGNQIYSNWAAPFYVQFIMDKSDPAEWDPIFAHLMKLTLAEGMANRFTRKNSYLQLIREQKSEALHVAEETEAFETGTDEAAVHDIIEVRKI